MPIALVPDGFTLKKVTKEQEDALKDHRKHEDFKAFLGSSGGGLTSGLIPILGIGLILLIPILLLIFRKDNGDPDYQTWDDYLKTNPSFWQMYAKGAAGISTTLQDVILPRIVREEILGYTGVDLDIGKQFNRLFEIEAELKRRKAEEEAQA